MESHESEKVKKPWYQIAIEIFGKAGAYILGAGVIVDKSGKTLNFLTLKVAVVITSALLFLYWLLFILFKYRKLKWKTKDGEVRKVVAIGKREIISFGVAILLVWGAAIYNYLCTPNKNAKKNTQSFNKIQKPIFDSSDRRFKILILPFDKECEYQNMSYDIGNVLSKRLQLISVQDGLDLGVYYLYDSVILKNFTPNTADSIMKYHHADQIIYGSYSLKQCEADGSNKICFNYRIDTSKWNTSLKVLNMSDYKSANFSGLEGLRNGSGQEDIDYVIYYISGMSFFYKMDFKKAIDRFRKIKNYIKNKEVGLHISICYIFLDEKIKAISYFDSILLTYPCCTDAISLKAILYLKQKEFEKAKNLFRVNLNCDNESSQNWNMLGFSFFMTNDCDSAIKCFDRALVIEPSNSIVLENMASCYMMTEQFEKAKSCYIKAIEINPSISAWHNLGLIYNKEDSVYRAIDCFKKALLEDIDNPVILTNLGQTYLEAHDFVNAKPLFEKVIQLEPKNELGYRGLGDIYIYSDGDRNITKSIENYRASLSINPSQLNVLLGLGSIYINVDSLDNAESCLLQALNIDANSYIGLYDLALVYGLKKNRERTLYYLSKAYKYSSKTKLLDRSQVSFKWLSKDPDFVKLNN